MNIKLEIANTAYFYFNGKISLSKFNGEQEYSLESLTDSEIISLNHGIITKAVTITEGFEEFTTKYEDIKSKYSGPKEDGGKLGLVSPVVVIDLKEVDKEPESKEVVSKETEVVLEEVKQIVTSENESPEVNDTTTKRTTSKRTTTK